jgi:predicted DNA-binding protein (MmcQ/YjbR family)
MDLSDFRDHCLALPNAVEDQPFGPEVLIFKVNGKMFAGLNLVDLPTRANLKCDPERALDLRDQHEAILPGYHMNKRHWNTLVLNGSLPQRLIQELIRHSYDLVVGKLPKGRRSAEATPKQNNTNQPKRPAKRPPAKTNSRPPNKN